MPPKRDWRDALRGRSPEPAPVPPPIPEPARQVEWERDSELPARLTRIKEASARLGCAEAGEALVRLVEATNGFTNIRAVLLAPKKERIEELVGMDIPSGRAKALAWEEVRAAQQLFSAEHPRGGSDWGRILTVFLRTLKPASGVPGVWEVFPPRESGDPGDVKWQRFRGWCDEHRVNAHELSRIAQRVRREIPGASAQSLQVSIEQLLVPESIDQVILAGYQGLDRIRVHDQTSGLYKPFDALKAELDPATREARTERIFARAKAAQEAVLSQQATKLTDGKWQLHRSDFLAREAWKDLQREARSAYDRVFEEGDREVSAEGAELSLDSAAEAFARQPTACVFTAFSRRTVDDQTRLFLHGIHPVNPHLIEALAGDSVHHDAPTYRLRDGEVVEQHTTRLVQGAGPALVTREAPSRNEGAVKALAKSLAWSEWNRTIRDLSFVRHNEGLSRRLEQLYHRSRGQLGERMVERRSYHDWLEGWYAERLKQLGGIATIGEATAREEELRAELVDYVPEAREALEVLERECPERVSIEGYDYMIEYFYAPGQDRYTGVPEADRFGGAITLAYRDPKRALLWPDDTRIMIGPPHASMAVEFLINKDLRSRYATDSVPALKEAIEEERLQKEWLQYPDHQRHWTFVIARGDPLPDLQEVAKEALGTPFAVRADGKPVYPKPYFSHLVQPLSGSELDLKQAKQLVQVTVRLAPTHREAEAENKKMRERYERFFLQPAT